MAKFYRLNEHIAAPSLRVINSKGEQLGILTRIEALEKAKQLGQDLIEIASNAEPPVAKIADFQKFRYEENKKERASKKGASAGGLKELWLSPRIAEHDLKVRLARTKEFFKEGYKVKFTVKFKGREMAHPEVGRQVLQEALNLLGDNVVIDKEAKFEGRKLSMIVGRGKSNPAQNDNNSKKEVMDNLADSVK